MIRTILLTLIALMMLPLAPARADDEIVVLFDRYNPPYMYDAEGKADGLYPAIITLVLEKMGKTATCKAVPWKRALDQASAGETAIGGLFKTAGREQIYDYSDAIYTERLLVYVNTDNDFEYKNLHILKDKTVGVLQGWSYGDKFDHAKAAQVFKTIPSNTDTHNFELLARGRLDCVIATYASGALVLQSGDYGMIRENSTPVAVNDTHLAFGKKANKKPLIEQFNATLRTLKESGEYTALLKRYGVLSEMRQP